MVLEKTLGSMADLVNSKQAKLKVREVENENRFASVKTVIDQMVNAANPQTKKQTEKARENAIAFQIDVNQAFGLAVSKRLFKFIQTGS